MGLSDRVLQFELNENYRLLMNPMTGAIDIAPTKLLKTMPEAAQEHFDTRGYFYSETDRTSQLEILARTAEKQNQNIPYWFYMLTTFDCNFGCGICYEQDLLKQGKKCLEKKQYADMSSQTVEKIIKTISSFQEEHHLPDSRINTVAFGGDPLCVKDKNIISQILEASSAHHWKTIIITNGSQINRFIDIFDEYANAISDFRITLDGPQAIHNIRRPYRGGKGSFNTVIHAIDQLLEKRLSVKMQTIAGAGNIDAFEELTMFVKKQRWLQHPLFQWRIEGSHDYANLDPEKDELPEGKIVQKLIQLWDNNQELHGKMKFESFKYLGHIVRSFGWLGEYKTYEGSKYGFCEPQKGFHYVFSTDGAIYHCPRTINNPDFYVGNTAQDMSLKGELKHKTILEKSNCAPCSINTLCGGGCLVQKKYYHDFDCQEYATAIITEFIGLMKDKILEKANPEMIVPVNNRW
ncbi:MAG: SPASM domain-containing protein [Candidatus Woesearchaeota archaeon]